MEYLLFLFVVSKTIFFKLYKLNAKKLQEKWFDTLDIFDFQSNAILWFIPLIFIFYNPWDASFFLDNITHLLIVSFIVVAWFIQEFIQYYVMSKTSNMIYLSAFFDIIRIPIYLFIWYFINKDIPNYFIIFSLVFLALALFIKPSSKKHISNWAMFSSWLLFIIFISLIWNILDAINNGFDRFILQNMNEVLFWVGLNMAVIMVPLKIILYFRKAKNKNKEKIKDNKYLIYSLPLFCFLWWIPEWYSFLHMPIYTVLGLSAVSFFMDLASDYRNNRIHFDFRTISFSMLILSSIIASVLSLKG